MPAQQAWTRELQRVIARLQNLPVGRIDEGVITLVHSAAVRIVALTDDPDRPSGAALPIVGPTALAAQLEIVTRDFEEKATATSEDAAVEEILIDLRRSLP